VLIPVAEGVSLAVASHGDGPAGPPLVLLHGYTGSAADWDGVVGPLAEHRRVLTVTHRGHGESTNTGDAATYTFDQLVADFGAVVGALDLPPFDLLGHSMGGIVAMRYALGHGDRLRSLLLMDTGAGASDDAGGHSFLRGGFDAARRHGLMAVHEAISQVIPEHQRARVRRCWEQLDVEAFTTLGEELLVHPSVLPLLACLDLPTTVLVGADDTGLRAAADDLAATIPGAALVVIDGAGHSPQEDQPEAWLAAVEGHLARLG
jgi:pimeloyl-ACP methyl ester carboxylesterase